MNNNLTFQFGMYEPATDLPHTPFDRHVERMV